VDQTFLLVLHFQVAQENGMRQQQQQQEQQQQHHHHHHHQQQQQQQQQQQEQQQLQDLHQQQIYSMSPEAMHHQHQRASMSGCSTGPPLARRTAPTRSLTGIPSSYRENMADLFGEADDMPRPSLR